ncbi:MAG: hypothetical protein FWG48_02100, partial [Oscillospiraceae bacterium]|nr:hypothetical protein [Oscillospiraceae bacterium]
FRKRSSSLRIALSLALQQAVTLARFIAAPLRIEAGFDSIHMEFMRSARVCAWMRIRAKEMK